MRISSCPSGATALGGAGTQAATFLLTDLATAIAIPAAPARAHAIAGPRVFVNTLIIDDPGVADEASFPKISIQQNPNGGGSTADANVEFDKTIKPNLGVGIGTDYLWNSGAPNGFDDLYVQLKYRWIVLPEHEFMSSVQVQQSFGHAGTPGVDSGYDTTTFSAYFGKGLGDIPFAPIRLFAITGELDDSIPNTGPSGGGSIATWSGGLSLQYSIPYLQSQIRNYGVPTILANLTPLVELGWQSVAGNSSRRPTDNPTQFLLGTGAAWTGQDYAVATELLWPLNGGTGQGLGFIAQFHVYFDDLFPNTLGKPALSW